MSEEARRIGRRMRELREALPDEPSQAALAAKLPGNVQGAEWSRWETGRHRPQSDTLDAIAEVLGTTAADLIAGPEDERQPKPTGDLFDAINGSAEGSAPDARVAQLRSEMAEVRAELSEVRTDLQHVLSLLRRGERDPGEEGTPPTS